MPRHSPNSWLLPNNKLADAAGDLDSRRFAIFRKLGVGTPLITSKANSQIKKAKALLRRSGREKWGQFLVEGVRLTEEAVGCAAVEVLYYTAKLLDTVRGEELLTAARARGIPIVECSEQVLAEMSDTVTPQEWCVVNKPAWTLLRPA